MTHRDKFLTGTLYLLLFIGCGAALWWFVGLGSDQSTKPTPPSAPATVAKTLKEDQINTLSLTDEAVKRLGLCTDVVDQKPIRRVRVYGGEATIPPGRSIIVAAPLSGIVRAVPSGFPQPGQEVKKGQPILQLLPLLSPEGRANLAAAKVEADGQAKSAQTQLDAARIALDRAKRVFQSDAGSQRAVDEAQALFDLAQKSLEAAVARCSLLGGVLGEGEAGTAAPLSIECPEDGLLRNVSALADQHVPAGAALFEVVDLSRVWVRVPVYVGDLPEVDTAADRSDWESHDPCG